MDRQTERTLTGIDLTELQPLIGRARGIMISTHVNPDGDGIGSGLGLYHALARAGKAVVFHMQDPVPAYLRFLPGSERIRHGQPNQSPQDLLITLDCGDYGRLGSAVGERRLYGHLLNIDHHVSNTAYGDSNVIRVDACAVGEIVFDLLQALNLPVDRDIATCLFTSLVTDTGSFRYSNTDVRALEVATALVRAGAEPWAVHAALYESVPPQQLRLAALALAGLRYFAEGRVGLIVVTEAMYAETGTGAEDTEGLIQFPRSVDTVEVAVLLRPAGGGAWKASLRSKRYVDVAAIAAQFGGGGHQRAAGCQLDGSLDAAVEQLLRAIQPVLR